MVHITMSSAKKGRHYIFTEMVQDHTNITICILHKTLFYIVNMKVWNVAVNVD